MVNIEINNNNMIIMINQQYTNIMYCYSAIVRFTALRFHVSPRLKADSDVCKLRAINVTTARDQHYIFVFLYRQGKFTSLPRINVLTDAILFCHFCLTVCLSVCLCISVSLSVCPSRGGVVTCI